MDSLLDVPDVLVPAAFRPPEVPCDATVVAGEGIRVDLLWVGGSANVVDPISELALVS